VNVDGLPAINCTKMCLYFRMKILPAYSFFRHLLIVFVALALASCAPQARVVGSWSDGVSRDQSFSRIMVVGISPDVNLRCDFEHFMVTQLRYAGASATTSCSLMSTKDDLSRETIEPAVAEYKADAVLTTVLVQSMVETKEGGDSDTRGGLYLKRTGSGFENYYTGGYGYYGVPVVYGEVREAAVINTVEGKVSILSMLYATSDATLVYQMTTTAHDLYSRDSGLSTVTPPIAKRLQKAGLISSGE
jgi:hypothetical protein